MVGLPFRDIDATEVTEPAPVGVTTIVPPVPVVNLPKLSAAPVLWATDSLDTMLALAVPVAVELLPVAAWATPGAASMATIRRGSIFITSIQPVAGGLDNYQL